MGLLGTGFLAIWNGIVLEAEMVRNGYRVVATSGRGQGGGGVRSGRT